MPSSPPPPWCGECCVVQQREKAGKHPQSAAQGCSAQELTTPPWTRSIRLAASSIRWWSGRSTTTPRGAEDPAALQGASGYHRHPRHGRAVRDGQAHGVAGAREPALSRIPPCAPRISTKQSRSSAPSMQGAERFPIPGHGGHSWPR